jgi:catechol 2,3-dioxygenase-like lactoylglutathione lyase family enzyme
MTVSLTGLGAITLFVEDLERSRSFYRDVFALKMIYEDEDSAAFDFGNTIVNLLSTPAARELVEPAAVAVPRRDRAFSSRSGSTMRMQPAWSSTRAAWSYSTAPWIVSGACARPASPTRPETSGRSHSGFDAAQPGFACPTGSRAAVISPWSAFKAAR